MKKPTTDYDLLRIIGTLRPLDYCCSIVAPDGSVMHEARFATEAEAKTWIAANQGERDMGIRHFVNSAERN
jgi:hypothetical protein